MSVSSSPSHAPIGIFDSGVGGLSIWREIVRELPHESTVYVADQAHVPYGPRTQEQIRGFCDGIAEFLLREGCKAIVVACNTASAAALKHLRERFPHLPVLGLEPAVKPAASLTRSGVIGVMATPATFQGRLYQATVGRHAAGVTVIARVCPGLAERVESGHLDDPETDRQLRDHVQPLLAAGADTIVLGCTHYPFVIEAIRRLAGPAVTVIDPAPAVARHLRNVLTHHGLHRHAGEAIHRFFTTGPETPFNEVAGRLTGKAVTAENIRWNQGKLDAAGPATAQGVVDAWPSQAMNPPLRRPGHM